MSHKIFGRPMSAALVVAPVWVAFFMLGCVPVTNGGGDGDHDDDLSARIVTVGEELRTLDEILFEVHIEDSGGHHVMDMAALELQVRSPDGEWREIELMAMDDHYLGEGVFSSSGEYELRVMGMSHMEHDMEEMFLTMVSVERAHADADPFDVEYESDPGHIHEGDTSLLNFWVSFEDGGGSASGLEAEIFVEESDGHVTILEAVEVEPGVYQAEMTFADAGEAHVGITLPDGATGSVEADFHLHVSEVH